MAFFQAKTWRDRLRMRENKIIVPIHSNPTRNTEFRKTSKRIQKIKKHHYGFISSQNRTWQVERDTKKKKLSFRSITTRPEIGNLQKNSKDVQKIKKHRCGFISSQNGTGQAEGDTKKKKVIVPIHSNPI